MLEAIATSMITVAGVTFSITIAALAQASSQYSPLILRNFMRDRANQVVLGAFGGIFVYCLIVLRSVRSGSEEFVPTVAVSVALLHALGGIGLLVFFVHHIASTLQASSILANISASARQTLERQYPLLEDAGGAADETEVDFAPLGGTTAWPIASRRSGYIQDIGDEAITKLAARHGVVMRLELGIGDFAIAGLPLACVFSHKPLDPDLQSALRDAVIIGDFRTGERDLAFAIRQIVDMAVKALSPGINDPTTACFCLHHLAAILAGIGNRRMPPRVRCIDGAVRLLGPSPTYENLLDLAFGEIRYYGGSHARVLVGIAAAIEAAGMRAVGQDRRNAVLRQLDLTADQARQSVSNTGALQEMLARVATARRAMGLQPSSCACSPGHPDLTS
jgi:uncharacterized membrane protein